MRVAALDLGTNTFLLTIAEVETGGSLNPFLGRTVHDEARIVRLGEGLHATKRLQPPALKRADEALAHYANVIQHHGCERVLAVATSAARDAQNSDELRAIAARHKIPLEIVDGEREAQYTFAGTLGREDNGRVLMIDVGGGSTEYILGDNRKLLARQSLNIGSVRLTEMFVSAHPIPKPDLEKLEQYITDALREQLRAEFREKVDRVIAVAGTATTLATLDQALPFESERVDGHMLTTAGLDQWMKRLAAMSVDERCQLAGMEPKRADVLPAGAAIFALSAHALGAEELRVSIRGLRYGVAAELASRPI